MKYKVGQKILIKDKVTEIDAVVKSSLGTIYYIAKNQKGWLKSENTSLSILSGSLNDTDRYYAYTEQGIDEFVKAYNKNSKRKNLPREYIVKTMNLEQAEAVGRFFRLNYPNHNHNCTYNCMDLAYYAVGNKNCNVFFTKSSFNEMPVFEFYQWKTIIDNQKFKIGDFLTERNGGKSEIKAIYLEGNENVYVSVAEGDGFGNKENYKIGFGEPILGALNGSENYVHFSDYDAVPYVETNIYQLSADEFDKAVKQIRITAASDIGNALKIQPVYFDNIPKTFKIKYQSVDGENKSPEITANSLEEALSTIKDLKEFHYHMEY